MSEATQVLLVRHGQTEWNAAGRVQGQTNSDLTELGHRQAAAVARWLRAPEGLPIVGRPSALYSSDLDRARQTSSPIAAALGLDPVLDPDLREMSFGELEGLTWDQVEERWPQIRLRLWGDDADPAARAPAGESRVDMHARSTRALTAIARRHPGQTVVVVSHGGVIGFFLRSVLGVPFERRPGFTTANGAVSAFRYREDRFKLQIWGLVPRLDPE